MDEIKILGMDQDLKEYLERSVFKGEIIERRQGRGGVIYIVEQPNSSPRRVAYKTIKTLEEGGAERVEAFIRETHNWVNFSGHYSIVTPHFVKVCAGIPLVCMPYCDGDLRQLVNARLDLIAVINISLQIVRGMIVANSRGMEFHQDIKPENILYVDLSNRFEGFPPVYVDASVKYSVKIADFGVANAWFVDYLGGTNAYKAPEQYVVNKSETFAPDIFAVGLIVAELYQGYHPAVTSANVDPGRSWNGSKLKRWASNGARNLADPQSPEAGGLVELIKEMISAEPDVRPSFSQCYDRLARLLQTLSPVSLEQMELLFESYDYYARHQSLEADLHRQLKIFEIPSKKKLVKAKFLYDLKVCLASNLGDLDWALEIHHRAKALQQVQKGAVAGEEKAILIEASRKVVLFVLERCKLITYSAVHPVLGFKEESPRQIGSDLEARSEVLCVNIQRLIYLESYDEGLRGLVESAGPEIQACILMEQATREWIANKWGRACALLEDAMQFAAHESQLESLLKSWQYMEQSYKGKGQDIFR